MFPSYSLSDMHKTTNNKLANRNNDINNVNQPHLSNRPSQTKYTYFPIVEPRKDPLFRGPNPVSATNVDTESELRNQIYALQKSSQAVYVPSSKSDLYSYTFQSKGQPASHDLLFRTEVFNSFNPNTTPSCGVGLFNNNTRCQLNDELTFKQKPVKK